MQYKIIILLALTALPSSVFSSNISNLLLGVDGENTPTELKQSADNTPGLITTITANDIKEYQLKTITDIFKFIPGFNVIKNDNGRHLVLYHDSSANRIQILVNGRPQSVGVLTFNPWHLIPVPTNEIDRINAYRSPAAAHFGSKSFSAVIDIITKNPAYSADKMSVSIDQNDELRLEGTKVIDIGKSSLSASFIFNTNKGYDQRQSDVNQNIDDSDIVFTGQDTTEATNYGMALSHRWNNDETIVRSDLHLSKGNRDNIFFGDSLSQAAEIDIERFILGSTMLHRSGNHNHKFDISISYFDNKEEFKTAGPKFLSWGITAQLQEQNPNYVSTLLAGSFPTGGTPADDALRDAIMFRLATETDARNIVTGDVNNNYTDENIALGYQNTINLENNRLLLGINYTNLESDSQTFFNGKAKREVVSQNTYFEYNLEPVVINIGYDVEWASSTGDSYFSPLLGINWHLNNNGVIKFLAARSSHAPDLVFTDLNWRYTATNLSEPVDGQDTVKTYITNRAPDKTLKSEKHDSISLAYSYQYNRLSLEVGVFRERKYDLSSNQFTYLYENLNNSGVVETKGIEAELDYDLNNQSIKAGFSVTENEANTLYEEAYFSNGSIFLQHAIQIGSNINLSSNIRYTDYDFYDDITAQIFLSKSVKTSGGTSIFSLGALYDDNFNRIVQNQAPETDFITYDVKKYNDELAFSLNYQLFIE